MSFVSIIIPCRNEEKYIGKCLDSVIAQDYPKDKLEILVIDGVSEDRTREIVRRYTQQYSFIGLLNNPEKIVPTALNMGVKNAQGDIIIRMDAHSVYKKNYIQMCVNYLDTCNVDNVGGVCVTLTGSNTLIAKATALALSHPFGVGNAHFRIGAKEPKYVDTVPFGCYRKDIFDRIGLFDEDLVRGQDAEFNARLIKNGGKILLVPDIVSYYYARDSLSKLWKMYSQYGRSKPLMVKKIGHIFTLRQLVPAIFIGSLIVSLVISIVFHPSLWFFSFVLGCYIIANLISSLRISLKNDLKCFFVLPVIFSILHLSYGIGYLKGIWDFIILKRYKKMGNIPLTR
jgi:cellulose synthase/poly-beta-1,6-N-acetylglucosamine synthase-like glycosyltransferase